MQFIHNINIISRIVKSDLGISILSALAIAATIAANYILHGGHIQW